MDTQTRDQCAEQSLATIEKLEIKEDSYFLYITLYC